MGLKLTVIFVAEATDGGFLDGAVHTFDLTICPGMLGPGEAMIDAFQCAGVFECVRAEMLFSLDHLTDLGRAPGVAFGVCEVNTVVGEHSVDLVRLGFDQVAQEVGRRAGGGFCVELGEGELGGCRIAKNDETGKSLEIRELSLP